MRRLILRPGAIGDCVLALPALEHLVAEYTEIWVPSAVAPLIRFASRVRALSSTGIDLVGVGDRALDPEVREQLQRFDSVVSWYGANRPEFRKAMVAAGVRCKFFPALPPVEYQGHASKFFCEQVGAQDAVPQIHFEARAVEAQEARPTVVVHPFSGSARKNWPLASYRALAARLDWKVEWLAGPEEHLPEATRFDDLYQLAQRLQSARVYVGNDSGITHLAAAVGVKTVALFGPTDPAKWAPRGANVTVLRCEPIKQMSVEEVAGAISRLRG